MTGLYKREKGKNVVDYEHLAKRLDGSPDHRVLRRVPALAPSAPAGAKCFRGLYLDVEATGLDVEKDEITEFAGIPFDFTSEGLIAAFHPPVHHYNQPSIPITDEITEITGITADMVAGRTLPRGELGVLMSGCQLVIAHNASYDRQMLEREIPEARTVRWGCSMDQVPWRENGLAGRRLEYLVTELGYFYDAHTAVPDCQAGLFALMSRLKDGRLALDHLLDATRRISYRVWALGAPYGVKDELKKRKYQWNGGEDGRHKAWSKEIGESDVEAEREWLLKLYRGSPELVRVTAFDRFTKRG